MSRPVRLEFAGANYYISCHAIDGLPLFRTDDDRAVFINILGSVTDQFQWILHGYVLMEDHYHLMLELDRTNLSRGMQQLNGVYTQHYNRMHNRSGTLFRGRFQNLVFEKKNCLLALYRHMVLNPVRSGLVSSPEEYIWSSHRQMAGQTAGHEFVNCRELLLQLARSQSQARKKYRDYVQEGLLASALRSPLDEKRHQVLLGSDRFIEKVLPLLKQSDKSGSGQRSLKSGNHRQTLAVIFSNVNGISRLERNLLIMRAHYEYGYALADIGEYLGLHYTTIRRVVNGKN
ncbi:MAG: transposase [Gammaproteobacteria bacterium]|nr:transposase [Gammaproteobacteria bacterium]